MCSGQEIYDSKNRLYRANLFFDGKGNEIKPGTEYDGELFVVTRKSNKEEYDDRITDLYHKPDYVISSIEINSHEVFRFDGEPYIFFRVIGSKLISHEVSWAEFETVESKRYSIYNDIAILFQASCNRYDVYFSIDGQTVSYGEETEFDYRIQILSTDYDGNWTYVLKIYHLEPGFHTIRVFNSKTNKQIKGANFGVVYDPDMWKSFISKDSSGISYEFFGSFTDNQVLVYEYGTRQKELHGFVKNLGLGSVIIYPSSISYSIDGQTWFDADHKLYLCEIPEFIKNLYVCGPKGMSAYLYSPEQLIKKQFLSMSKEDGDTCYKLFIDYLRTVSDKRSVRIVLEYGNRTKFFNVWYYPFITKDDCKMYFDTEQNAHVIKIFFEGTSKIKAVVHPVNSDQVIVSKVISSGEEIILHDSDIPKSVRFLSVALCGRKYGSMFDPYQKEPFVTLPKYDLGRATVKLTTWPPNLQYDNARHAFNFQFGFVGAERIRIDVCPSGYKKALFSKSVSSGEQCFCDLSAYLFNSYNVLLFGSTDDKGLVFDEKPFFISKAIKANSPFLKQKYQISHFIMSDGSKLTANYALYFVKYTEVQDTYCWLCKLIDNRTGTSYDDILVSLKKTKSFSYEVALMRMTKGKLNYLKFKDGGQIKGAILDKLGDWK